MSLTHSHCRRISSPGKTCANVEMHPWCERCSFTAFHYDLLILKVRLQSHYYGSQLQLGQPYENMQICRKLKMIDCWCPTVSGVLTVSGVPTLRTWLLRSWLRTLKKVCANEVIRIQRSLEYKTILARQLLQVSLTGSWYYLAREYHRDFGVSL